jgi:hypothetical protein
LPLRVCRHDANAASCVFDGGTYLLGKECDDLGTFCSYASETIGSDGAVRSPDGSLSVQFPTGCLSADTTITVAEGDGIFVEGATGRTFTVYRSFYLEPEDLEFPCEAELCIQFDRRQTDMSLVDCSSLIIVRNDSRCVGGPTPNAQCDDTPGRCGTDGVCEYLTDIITPSSRECPPASEPPGSPIARICANISHFSEYGVAQPDHDVSIPTVSAWGLGALTLLLLIGAKVRYGRTTDSSEPAPT